MISSLDHFYICYPYLVSHPMVSSCLSNLNLSTCSGFLPIHRHIALLNLCLFAGNLHILFFWQSILKSVLSFSIGTASNNLWISPSLSAINAVSSAYLKLQFVPSRSTPLHVLVLLRASSLYRLNQPGDRMQPCQTPFFMMIIIW